MVKCLCKGRIKVFAGKASRFRLKAEEEKKEKKVSLKLILAYWKILIPLNS